MQDEFKQLTSKFPLGQTVMTRGAQAALTIDDILAGIMRHAAGDWGDLDPPDKRRNEEALKDGGRLVSRYRSSTGILFYIITEWDRSVTTTLLPQEY